MMMSEKIKPVYYDCGICDHFHPWDWNGDCRDDPNRLTYDDLDARHGENGYEIRSMGDRSTQDQEDHDSMVESTVDRQIFDEITRKHKAIVEEVRPPAERLTGNETRT